MDVQQYLATKAAVDADAPTGLWSTAPSLAATTVPMVNTSGREVEVGITGGTYTVVKKNGVTLPGVTSAIYGSFPARIRLGAGASLAITYSAAPTLQWLYA